LKKIARSDERGYVGSGQQSGARRAARPVEPMFDEGMGQGKKKYYN
jgi:hypothetical protein